MISVDMGKFLCDLGFLSPLMYGYATVSYNLILDHLTFRPAHTAVTAAVLMVEKDFRQSQMV